MKKLLFLLLALASFGAEARLFGVSALGTGSGYPVVGCAANTILYADGTSLLACSANLTYVDSTIRLTVGTGSGTSAGWIAGYNGNSGYSGLWSTAQTPSTSNGILQSNGTDVYLQGNSIFLRSIGSVLKFQLDASVAGAGPAITAGTATTDVAALSITRTNNNAAVATGVKITFTDTTSAAGFLPFQILGGSGGTTELLALSKAGQFNAVTIATPLSTGNRSTLLGALGGGVFGVGLTSTGVFGMSSGADSATPDTAFSRISAGVIGVGTGAAGSVAGTLGATNLSVYNSLGNSSFAITNAGGTGANSVSITGVVSSGAAQTGYLCYNTTGSIVTYDSGATCLISREEYKNNLGPITGAMETISALHPFWGNYKTGTPMQDHSVQPFFGARYTATVDRRLVSFDAKGEPLGVRYENMSALLAAGLQELDARLKTLEAANDGTYKVRAGL